MRFLSLFPRRLIPCLVVLIFYGCGRVYELKENPSAQKEEKKVVTDFLDVFAWNRYLPPEVLDDFKHEFGVSINLTLYQSNDQLYKALKEGGDHDLIMPSGYLAQRLIHDGYLAPLDHQNIPNLRNLEPGMRDSPHDPNQQFTIPYLWGTVGIGYNSHRIPDIPMTWGDLFNPKHAPLQKKITILNEMRCALGSALISLGYSPNTKNPDEVQKAGEVLKHLKPYVWKYATDNTRNYLAQEQSLMSLGWAADIALAMQKNPNVRMSIPEEGAILFVDGFGIPKTSGKKKIAETFLNYLLRPEVSARVANFSFYASANKEARPFIKREVLNGPSYMAPVNEKTFHLEDLGDSQSIYEKVWAEVHSFQATVEPVH